MITYHKAIADTGGAIGTEIDSGIVGELLPEVTLAQQSSGATISRKLYIKNDGLTDFEISNLSMDASTPFTAILFESSGDAEVVGDLTGSETDESPITVTIPASSHKSFWVQLDVPTSSTETEWYGSADIKQVEG